MISRTLHLLVFTLTYDSNNGNSRPNPSRMPSSLDLIITKPGKRLGTNTNKMAFNRRVNKSESLILQLKEGLFDWILMSPTSKAAIYWLIVIAGSFIHDFLPLPQSYFSNKKNVLNVYFVKLGWGWTLALLVPFISFTSFIYTSCNVAAMLRHLSRLIVATFGWYIFVNLFSHIEELTGVCEGEESITSKRSCYLQGYLWAGFDISGHAFLLVYSALIISEEIQVKQWLSVTTIARNVSEPHRRLNIFLCRLTDFFFVGSSILLLLWEFMLVSTAMYFHPVQEKVIGAMVALFTWHITYKVWYKNEVSPGVPWQPPKRL